MYRSMQTRVSVHQWSVVHDEKYFHRPAEFIPERWIKGEKASQMGDRLEASQPFSYGPRGCLGKKYVAYPPLHLVMMFSN
jgi:cytochrome P450